MDVYNTFGGQSWRDKQGWGSASPPCSWARVGCTAEGAVSLDLSYNNVTGVVPTTVCLVENITSLDVSGNAGIRSFAPGFSAACSTLRSLFAEELPSLEANITDLLSPSSALQVFQLGDSALVNGTLGGPLPAGLSHLWLRGLSSVTVPLTALLAPTAPPPAALRSLHLQDLPLLNGSVADVCGLISLQELSLNNLTGLTVGSSSLQPCLFEPPLSTSLVTLRLSRLPMTGSAPPELSQAIALQELELSHMPVCGGDTVQLIQSLPQLQSLTLAACDGLAGTFTSLFSSLMYDRQDSTLVKVDVSDNAEITGSLPFALCVDRNGSSLRWLDASGTSVDGPLPSFSGCTQLQHFACVSCSLNGTLVEVMPALEHLDLSYNTGISGSFPAQLLSGSPRLKLLDLRRTSIAGTLPATREWNVSACVDSLQILLLEGIAGLVGPLPDWVALTALSVIDVSSTGLSGPLPFLPSSLVAYRSDGVAYTPGRNLTDQFAQAPTNFPGLQYFLIQGGRMQGRIPAKLITHPEILAVDLSGNSFSLLECPFPVGVQQNDRTPVKLRLFSLAGNDIVETVNDGMVRRRQLLSDHIAGINPFDHPSHDVDEHLDMPFSDWHSPVNGSAADGGVHDRRGRRLQSLRFIDLPVACLVNGVRLSRVFHFMDFSQTGLKYSMSPYLGLIPGLEVLLLNDNALVDSAPPEWIESTSKVLVSRLQGGTSTLTEPIFASARVLRFDNNRLSGSLEDWLLTLAVAEKLERIDFSGNPFLTGKLGGYQGQGTYFGLPLADPLAAASPASRRLTAAAAAAGFPSTVILPPGAEGLVRIFPNLQVLLVAGNTGLSGPLPTLLPPSLAVVSIQGCAGLSGPIPESWSQLLVLQAAGAVGLRGVQVTDPQPGYGCPADSRFALTCDGIANRSISAGGTSGSSSFTPPQNSTGARMLQSSAISLVGTQHRLPCFVGCAGDVAVTPEVLVPPTGNSTPTVQGICICGEASSPGRFVTLEQSYDEFARCRCVAGFYGAGCGCTVCPPGSSTRGPGMAATISDCVCDPGTYPRYGIHPRTGSTTMQCEPCPIGTFSPGNGMQWCLQCPPGTNTSGVGATDEAACICAAGFSPVRIPLSINISLGYTTGNTSNTSATGCEPCAPNTFKSNLGNAVCQLCARGTWAPPASTTCMPCTQSPGVECAAGVSFKKGYFVDTQLTPMVPVQYLYPPVADVAVGPGWRPLRLLTATGTAGTNMTTLAPNPSAAVWPCLNPDACIPSADGRSVQCAEGSQGLLCGSCAPGYYSPAHGRAACLACPSATGILARSSMRVLVGFGFLVFHMAVVRLDPWRRSSKRLVTIALLARTAEAHVLFLHLALSGTRAVADVLPGWSSILLDWDLYAILVAARCTQPNLSVQSLQDVASAGAATVSTSIALLVFIVSARVGGASARESLIYAGCNALYSMLVLHPGMMQLLLRSALCVQLGPVSVAAADSAIGCTERSFLARAGPGIFITALFVPIMVIVAVNYLTSLRSRLYDGGSSSDTPSLSALLPAPARLLRSCAQRFDVLGACCRCLLRQDRFRSGHAGPNGTGVTPGSSGLPRRDIDTHGAVRPITLPGVHRLYGIFTAGLRVKGDQRSVGPYIISSQSMEGVTWNVWFILRGIAISAAYAASTDPALQTLGGATVLAAALVLQIVTQPFVSRTVSVMEVVSIAVLLLTHGLAFISYTSQANSSSMAGIGPSAGGSVSGLPSVIASSCSGLAILLNSSVLVCCGLFMTRSFLKVWPIERWPRPRAAISTLGKALFRACCVCREDRQVMFEPHPKLPPPLPPRLMVPPPGGSQSLTAMLPPDGHWMPSPIVTAGPMLELSAVPHPASQWPPQQPSPTRLSATAVATAGSAAVTAASSASTPSSTTSSGATPSSSGSGSGHGSASSSAGTPPTPGSFFPVPLLPPPLPLPAAALLNGPADVGVAPMTQPAAALSPALYLPSRGIRSSRSLLGPLPPIAEEDAPRAAAVQTESAPPRPQRSSRPSFSS